MHGVAFISVLLGTCCEHKCILHLFSVPYCLVYSIRWWSEVLNNAQIVLEGRWDWNHSYARSIDFYDTPCKKRLQTCPRACQRD